MRRVPLHRPTSGPDDPRAIPPKRGRPFKPGNRYRMQPGEQPGRRLHSNAQHAASGSAMSRPTYAQPRATYTVQQAAAQAQRQSRTPDRPDRTQQVATLVRTFGGPFQVVSSADLLGICEVLDTRRPNAADQRCQSKATRAVVFDTSAYGIPTLHTYTCAVHAEQLAAESRVGAEVRALR